MDFVAKSTSEHSDHSDVERQTELVYKENTIWTAVYNADKVAIDRLLDLNPDVINVKGAAGECPIHMLFLCGTEKHLEIARELIIRFPRIVTQTYSKYVGLFTFSTLHGSYKLFRDIMAKIFFIWL